MLRKITANLHKKYSTITKNFLENSVDKHVRVPKSYASEIREIHKLNNTMTVNEVLSDIGKLKTNKAAGYDNIVNEHIKYTKNFA